MHNRTGLDIGEFPESDNVAGTSEDDPTRLVGILSHMVARTFDRFAPLRKLSRQAEGADKRSGFLSDAFAAAVELYRRNPDKLQEVASDYARELKTKRAEATQRNKQNKRTGNGKVAGVTPTVGVSQ